jgi:epsilon-lactone hydrolase
MTLPMSATYALLRLRHRSTESEATLRASLDPRRPPAPIPPALRARNLVQVETVAGREVVTLTPADGGSARELVYLHGGSYAHEMQALHWGIVDRLQRGTGATVTVPHYGLAPEHTAPDAYALLDTVYAAVRARAGSRAVSLVGDSAGAGLAVGVAMSLRDRGEAPPASLVLFSPWVDATMDNPDIAPIEPADRVLGVAGLRAAALDWAGAWTPSHPLVSPVNGSLGGLPPTTILQGGRDVFLPDVRRFARLARAAGTAVDLRIYPAGFHVFVAAHWTPEGRSALRAACGAVLAG